jgi:hypothetical protein
MAVKNKNNKNIIKRIEEQEVVSVNENLKEENEILEPITLIFTTIPVGVYPLNNDGTYDIVLKEGKTYYGVVNSSDDYDIYINKNIYTGLWSKQGTVDKNIVYTQENALLEQNINGYENSFNIYQELENNAPVIASALSNKEIKNIQWFLPSYYELSMMVNTDETIEMLKTIGGVELYGHTILTSNVVDNFNVWGYYNTTEDGEIVDIAVSSMRTMPNEYRIIGKKIL